MRGKKKKKNIVIYLVIIVVIFAICIVVINKSKNTNVLPNFEKEKIFTIAIAEGKNQAVLYREDDVNSFLDKTLDKKIKEKKSLNNLLNEVPKEKINLEISVKDKVYYLELLNVNNEYLIVEKNGGIYKFTKEKFEKVKKVLAEKAI